MILVDSAKGSWELKSLLQRQGIITDIASMKYADACFEGNGPDGIVGVGIERKRPQDMLDCIDDGRYTGHQRVGMGKMYKFNFLVIEGYWRPDVRSGLMLFGIPKPDGTMFWSSKSPRGQRVMYRKMRRYLFSASLARVVVLYTRDIAHTAYDIVELYHWFQKPWRDHKAMLAMHQGYFWQQEGRSDELMTLPTLDHKPSLVRRWAAELGGIGVKKSEDAERVFRTPHALANSEELDWMKLEGVGVGTAQSVVAEIMGWKR